MRFLVLMIPGVYQGGKKTNPNFIPDAGKMEKMGKFNEELKKSVTLLGLDGLKPLSAGARVTFAGGKAKVTDGPFVEAKEVLGGYWMLEAKSKEQVVELMTHCPAEEDDTIEIRPIFDLADFPIHRAAAQGGAR
jgi:hypothetical protein